jgi:GT2 family glycosyltransferase
VTARVVAIVLNWCNESDTAACLDSLLASSYAHLEVLLIDNGSPDGSGERLHQRYPSLPYLQTGSNTGYAGGNNRGFEWALARDAAFVLVLNNDTLVDRDCVAELVKAATETGAAVAAPQITYYDDPDRVWYGGGRFSVRRALGVHDGENEPVDAAQQRSMVTFVCGCCFLVRADTIRSVGGFDETFFAYVEDAELSLRVTRAGGTMVYEPRARLLHRIQPNATPSPFQLRQRERNRRRLVARHYGMGEWLRFALWFYPTRLMHIARYVATGDWSRARAVVSGTFRSLTADPRPPTP